MPTQNNNFPISQFTPEELEHIKKMTNPEYNSELVSEQIRELFGSPDIIEKQEDNKEYPINVLANKPDITEFVQTVSIDPNSGLHTPISKDELAQSLGQDISLEYIEDFDPNNIEIKDSDAESLQSLFGLDLKESMKLIELIREVKNGDDKNLFSRLPASMKHQLVSMCGKNTATLNKTAKEFINMAISQIGTDQAFVDLETGIKNATEEMVEGYKNLAKEASQIEDDDYNIRLKLYIDNLKQKSPDKKEDIEKWESVRNKYLSAVDFSELKEAIKSNPKLTKKLDKYSRMVRDFNYKYTSETKKTKFACRDINYATNVLARVLDPREYSNELIKKFICVICNYTKNFDATNIIDHTFMYFTVKTIVSIETFNYRDEKYNTIISSIKDILELLK